MKDYAKNNEERKTFILKYEIMNNEIIVYLANKQKEIIPYTKEKEIEILKKMKEQITNSDELDIYRRLIKYEIMNEAIIPTSIILGLFVKNIELLIYLTSIGYISSAMLISLLESNKIKDLRKNQLFLENEEIIKKELTSNNHILDNINQKKKNIIQSKDNITLNDIDKISLDDLNTILNNISKETNTKKRKR